MPHVKRADLQRQLARGLVGHVGAGASAQEVLHDLGRLHPCRRTSPLQLPPEGDSLQALQLGRNRGRGHRWRSGWSKGRARQVARRGRVGFLAERHVARLRLALHHLHLERDAVAGLPSLVLRLVYKNISAVLVEEDPAIYEAVALARIEGLDHTSVLILHRPIGSHGRLLLFGGEPRHGLRNLPQVVGLRGALGVDPYLEEDLVSDLERPYLRVVQERVSVVLCQHLWTTYKSVAVGLVEGLDEAGASELLRALGASVAAGHVPASGLRIDLDSLQLALRVLLELEAHAQTNAQAVHVLLVEIHVLSPAVVDVLAVNEAEALLRIHHLHNTLVPLGPVPSRRSAARARTAGARLRRRSGVVGLGLGHHPEQLDRLRLVVKTARPDHPDREANGVAQVQAGELFLIQGCVATVDNLQLFALDKTDALVLIERLDRALMSAVAVVRSP
mmetsp:Transcript_77253/g.219019  ORF Transcript_77253/g.219019 Transcript_77253/m.219019 type:complete len:447 (-) Transcript_77253:809-2149(-)